MLKTFPGVCSFLWVFAEECLGGTTCFHISEKSVTVRMNNKNDREEFYVKMMYIGINSNRKL